ncbi:MAG: hypothetical protein AAGA74_12350 [Pseudomonadota bacterium]
MDEDNTGSGNSSNSNRQTLYVSDLLSEDTVQPSYPQKRDGWITLTALGIIGLTAGVSLLALIIFPIFVEECDAAGVCKAAESPAWAAEMLRLTLVSCLAFVMGANSQQS